MSNGVSNVYEFGPFRVDVAERVVLCEGKTVSLTPKDFDLLLVFVESPGHLLEKEELMRKLWAGSFVEEANLARHVFNLRKALGEGAGKFWQIETVPRRGYRFVGEVRVLKGESAEPVPGPDSPLSARLHAAPPWTARRIAWLGAGLSLAAIVWYIFPRDGVEPPLKNLTFTQLTGLPGPELYPSLSPDGHSVVFASRASGNSDIYLQRVGGKNVLNLTKDSPADDTQPAFSPDGRHIAFRSERDGGGIFLMEATGESVRRLEDFGYHPAWSPDGSEVVCATGGFARPDYRWGYGSKLFAVSVGSGLGDPRSGGKRLISGKITDALQPNWSPHSRRIAYRDGFDISTVAIQGGEAVPVTRDPARDWNPVWSPDGRYLYFSSDRSGSMNLWRVRIDEDSGKVLHPPEPVTTPSPYSGYISLSQDGRRLAYAQQFTTTNIYRVGFDPRVGTAIGEPVPVTQGSRQTWMPDLSPDGEWLAFTSCENREDLFIIKTDGTNLRQLTDDADRDRLPIFSPDGKRIAFYSTRSKVGSYELWMIEVNGSGLRPLTDTSGRIASTPVWSPDGTRFAYTRTDSHDSFIMDPRLPWRDQIHAPLRRLGEPAGWFLVRSWSPDGKKLAGERRRDGDSPAGILVYSLEQGRFDQLTESGLYPFWLSDSRRLLFVDRGKICLVDSISGKTRQVLSIAPYEVSPFRFVMSRDNRWIYFSRMMIEADIWLATLE